MEKKFFSFLFNTEFYYGISKETIRMPFRGLTMLKSPKLINHKRGFVLRIRHGVLAFEREDICSCLQKVEVLIPITIRPFECLQGNLFRTGRHLCVGVVLVLEDFVSRNSGELEYFVKDSGELG